MIAWIVGCRVGMSYAHIIKSNGLYCDECKEEVDKLYKYGEEELCEDCLVEEFEVIELEEN